MRGPWLVAARTVWVAVAVFGVALFVASIPAYHERVRALSGFGFYATAPPGVVRAALDELGISAGLYAAYDVVFMVTLALGYWAVGAMIFWRRSDDGWTLFLSLVLVTFGSIVGNTYYSLSQVHPALVLLGDVIGNFAFVSFWLLLYLFPDGRFVPRWTRWVAAFYIAYFVVDWIFPNSPYNLDNRGLLGAIVMIVVVGSMVYAQVFRYRRVSGPTERQQTKWAAFGFVMAVGSFFTFGYATYLFLSPDNPGVADVFYELVARTVVGLAFLLVPLSIGVAILRYRLWDIDLIINRTLVYGALTACVAGIYVLVVGYLGTTFRLDGNLFLSLIATGIVAVLFAPLRDRLQRAVNRLMYGERDDPYKVLSGLGARLEATVAPDAVLPTLMEAITEALKLPYAAITLDHDGKGFVKAAEQGKNPDGDSLVVPLVYQREKVGELVLAPRSPGESFTRADLRLLGDLAHQIGVVAHAVRLTAELQRSRERLVTAREEERRRLRRDLHDGVGPQLAALMLELETASELVSENPGASTLIAKLSGRTREIVSDVRRSVRALRPPAL
ncbi:MAG: histidine kinase, partial [Rubrobacter sp.]